MTPRLKPIGEQVIVITGASSGIGLATARAAAARGARVVLAGRGRAALDSAVEGIRADGGEAVGVVTDVSERAQVETLAATAIKAFGPFDTWVNNAGVGIFGRLDEVPEQEHRRLFDVNYWGVVNGSLVAVEHLRRSGGALVNLGSILSDVAVPMQGPYSASKAAVRGFTDALRQELTHEGAPISVSLIKPAGIATPFPEHARNHMDRQPALPPPLYRPEDAAEVILHAAEHGGRDLHVGAGATAILLANKLAPGLLDRAGAALGPALQRRRREPTSPVDGNLFRPSADDRIHGERTSVVFRATSAAADRGRGGIMRSGGSATSLGAAALLVFAGAAMVLGRRS